MAALLACGSGVPQDLRPDAVLRSNLGLGDDDEVHTVRLRARDRETAEPAETDVPAGAWVQFVPADGFIHEVVFEVDSLPAAARRFLESTDQVSSPPLPGPDHRYVVSFRGAPPGRYPFRLEGNQPPGRGVVTVRATP